MFYRFHIFTGRRQSGLNQEIICFTSKDVRYSDKNWVISCLMLVFINAKVKVKNILGPIAAEIFHTAIARPKRWDPGLMYSTSLNYIVIVCYVSHEWNWILLNKAYFRFNQSDKPCNPIKVHFMSKFLCRHWLEMSHLYCWLSGQSEPYLTQHNWPSL